MQIGKPATKRIVRVLIMDEQYAVRQALSAIINRQPDMQVVAESENPSELLETFKKNRPDVVLLDMEASGGSEIRSILEYDPSVRIIALSLYEDLQTVKLVLQAGALMWMLKGSGKAELLEAIRTCMKSAPVHRQQLAADPS